MLTASSWKAVLQLSLLAMLVCLSQASSSFTVNHKYSLVGIIHKYEGRSVIDMAAQTKGESPSNWKKVVTICFSKAFINTRIVAAASLGSIEVRNISNMLSFEVGLNGISNSSLLVYIKAIDASKISLLSISYLLYYDQP
jgi:hypothetical protein